MRCAPRCRPHLEFLEARLVPSGDPLWLATPLEFDIPLTGALTDFSQVQLYSFEMGASDEAVVQVVAQGAGSTLIPELRVFDSAGEFLGQGVGSAGADPGLHFRAAAAGTYYVGVAGAATIGTYALTVSQFRDAGDTLAYAGSAVVGDKGLGGLVSGPADVDLYAVTLGRGDQVAVGLDVLALRSSLAGVVRIFDAEGRQLGFADSAGLVDPAVYFAAPETGTYYIGVSGNGQRNYDARQISAAALDGTSGVYRLHVNVAQAPAREQEGTTQPAVSNNAFARAEAITYLTQLKGSLPTGAAPDRDYYRFTVPEAGLFSVLLRPDSGPSLQARLRLYDAAQQLLLQADDVQKGANAVSLVRLELLAGTYYVEVAAPGGVAAGGTQAYSLDTTFHPVQAAAPPALLGGPPSSVASADLNRDGIADRVTANVGANTLRARLGNADGTLREPVSLPLDPALTVISLLVVDVNHDGVVDIVTGNAGPNLSLLLGHGDGSFEPALTYALAAAPTGIVVADFNGDGHSDIAASSTGAAQAGVVSLLLGQAGGGFAAAAGPALGTYASALASADVDGDGRPDLVAAAYGAGEVMVLHNQEGAAFKSPERLNVAQKPRALALRDLNGDGRPDLVVANAGSNNVSVLLGKATGGFLGPVDFDVGTSPAALALGDVDRDGRLDVVVANRDSRDVSILLGTGTGSFLPQRRFAVGALPESLALADHNRDGFVDLLVSGAGAANVLVLLGSGDGAFDSGSFQAATGSGIGSQPAAQLLRDLNRDGIADLVTANQGSDDVSVLLGNGDGSFQAGRRFAAGPGPSALASGDFNGDGVIDLVVANTGSGAISVLLGSGSYQSDPVLLRVSHGTFRGPLSFAVGQAPVALAVADVDGDDNLDLLVADAAHAVAVLRGRGDGTFAPGGLSALALIPTTLTTADLNEDGFVDVLVGGRGAAGGAVVSLLGDGHGAFHHAGLLHAEAEPVALVLRDIDGDALRDIVIAGRRADEPGIVQVFLGERSDAFRATDSYAVGVDPSALVLRDVNRDQAVDIIVASVADNEVTLLLNERAAGFVPAGRFAVGAAPRSLEAADFTGDGLVDILAVNSGSSDVSLLVGNGSGAFQPRPGGGGAQPTAVALGDVNGDGFADLVSASRFADTATVQLGNGDGSFQPGQPFAVGVQPADLLLGDVNRDRKLDLLISAAATDRVAVLLGNGDGTFLPLSFIAAGAEPQGLVLADVNGDGRADLLVAASGADQVTVLIGDGRGGFEHRTHIPTPPRPTRVLAADIDGDGKLDLVIAASGGPTLAAGNGDGSFGRAAPLHLPGPDRDGDGAADGLELELLGAADLDGDGRLDLVAASPAAQSLKVFLGDDSGAFQPGLDATLGGAAGAVAMADVNGDRRLDLVVTRSGSTDVSVLLNRGRAVFQPFSLSSGIGLRSLPLVHDFDGDGKADIVTLDPGGGLLLTPGMRGSETPATVLLNAQQPARDATLIALGNGRTGIAVAHLLDNGFSIYEWSAATGTFRVMATNFLNAAPVRVASPGAQALAPGQLADLVIATALSDQVAIARQISPGVFAAPIYRTVGTSPSDITFLKGTHGPDIVVSGQSAGDITILRNDAQHSFLAEARFAASSGPYRLTPAPSGVALTSAQQTVAVTAAPIFTPADLVTVNRGSHSITVLPGAGQNVFSAPAGSYRTSADPGQVAAADVSGDGRTDVLVLMRDVGQVWVYANRGDGTLSTPLTSAVGSNPRGFTLADRNGDGSLDLIVSNAFGSILVLFGDGRGRFIAFPADRPLLVGDLDGNGAADVLLAGPLGLERVFAYYGQAGKSFSPALPDGLGQRLHQPILVSSAAQLVQLDRRAGPTNLIVAASLFNQLVIYHDATPGRFANADTYNVGLDPVAVDVGDLDGDSVPDIVIANRGSGDLSILLGRVDANTGRWSGAAGPRVPTGGAPAGVALVDVNGDEVLDFLVTDAAGNQRVIPGIASRALLLQALGLIPKTVAPPSSRPVDSGAGVPAVPPALRPPIVVIGDRPLLNDPGPPGLILFSGPSLTAFPTELGVVLVPTAVPPAALFVTLSSTPPAVPAPAGPPANSNNLTLASILPPAVVQAVMPLALAVSLTGISSSEDPLVLADLLRDPEAEHRAPPAAGEGAALAPAAASAEPEQVPAWAAFRFGLDDVFARHVGGFRSRSVAAAASMLSEPAPERGAVRQPAAAPETGAVEVESDVMQTSAAPAPERPGDPSPPPAPETSAGRLPWLPLALAISGWLAHHLWVPSSPARIGARQTAKGLRMDRFPDKV